MTLINVNFRLDRSIVTFMNKVIRENPFELTRPRLLNFMICQLPKLTTYQISFMSWVDMRNRLKTLPLSVELWIAFIVP